MDFLKINLSEIDSVYMNLDNQIKRRTSLLKSFKLNKIIKKLRRVEAIEETPYTLGLAKTLIKAFNQHKYGMLAIYEDDARPIQEFDKQLEIPADADAVYLGISCLSCDLESGPIKHGLKLKSTPYENTYRVINGLSHHAVLYVSKEYMNKMQEEIEKTIDSYYKGTLENEELLFIDVIASTIQKEFNVYVVDPIKFYQNDEFKSEQIEHTKDCLFRRGLSSFCY